VPVLANPKHERFAQLVAKGVSYTEAAKTVGYSELRASAQGSTLAKHRNVAARISELSARVADQTASSASVSKAWVIERLIENAKKPGSMVTVRALELIGKELGMFVDRKDMTIRATKLDEIPEDELIAAAREAGISIDPQVLEGPSGIQ
jgi:uncharacterized protein YoaH (UPF0181 family)